MKICVVGAGYVGLVSGACFAEFGHDVTCVDTDAEKVARLVQGEIPIYEPGLDTLVARNIRQGSLHFSTSLDPVVGESDVVFIAVGTPTSRRGSGYADMGYVHAAAKDIAPLLQGYTVIVNKSTVPVGSARQVARIIADENSQANFDVASNPEFLREGMAIDDFMKPDRVVIGSDSESAKKVLAEVYRPLENDHPCVIYMNQESAELVKYASNAFLATKISFINEMANLCESVNADVQSVSLGMGLDSRIGPKFLQAGPGYGGSCFPKDTMALLRIAQEQSMPCRITETVVEVNNAQKARMVGKIRDAVGGELAGKTIGILGLTFKPDTDDMRESPALTIIPALLDKGARVRAHDPVGMDAARELLGDITYCQDAYDVCEGVDAVCLLTEWNVYRALDLDRIRAAVREPVFIDLRNVYNPQDVIDRGFAYTAVGRVQSAVSTQCVRVA